MDWVLFIGGLLFLGLVVQDKVGYQRTRAKQQERMMTILNETIDTLKLTVASLEQQIEVRKEREKMLREMLELHGIHLECSSGG